jgi:hypothetical protein
VTVPEATPEMPTADALASLRDLCKLRGAQLSLADLVVAGIDQLPLPGSGRTLERWRVLAEVAALDLPLAKLFEGHMDALAIRAELGAPPPGAGTHWGTWCAEPPDARVALASDNDARVRLHGTKAWCSGAAVVSHAVMSAWNAAGKPCLVEVAMDQPGVAITADGWRAVGMAGTGSVDVRFEGAEAAPLGHPGDYVARAGFWQGAAGIAACWFGGALGIARMTRGFVGKSADAHRLAHLGAIDAALAAAAALLRESAAAIDARPQAFARDIALRARLAVEHAAIEVMHHAGRATGAGPLCRDTRFAQAMADLPVFLRQSHAERDLASLGERIPDMEPLSWKL